MKPDAEAAASEVALVGTAHTKKISKRYTMLLDNGVIKKIVEEEGKCELTAADNFLREI